MTTIAESPRNERTQRTKRIELAIAPGRSLGPFRLGNKEQHLFSLSHPTSLYPHSRFNTLGHYSVSSRSTTVFPFGRVKV